MQRLLIVDDMPLVADGLVDMFSEHSELDLEIYHSYSALEALDTLRKLKIDVVLTDIKMPGMSGLELLQEIHKQWPRCKVIFLTSYNDFNYAKEAISSGGFDYILKTEDEDCIIDTVSKALNSIRSELEADAWINKARDQYIQAKPILQKQYFLEMLEGRCSSADRRNEKFEQLEIPLSPSIPIYLVLMRLDGVKEKISYSGLVRRLYSVQNIMSDYLNCRVKTYPIHYNRSEHIWLLQPEKIKSYNEEAWRNIFNFIYGNMETVQNLCSSLLKLKVSLVVSSEPVIWDELADRFLRMESLLNNGIGFNSEVLTTDAELQKNSNEERFYSNESRMRPKGINTSRLNNLAESLNNGHEDDFKEIYTELVKMAKEFDGNLEARLEVYHYLSFAFLSHINRQNLFDEVKLRIDVNKLVCFDDKISWVEYLQYFNEVADILFKYRIIECEQGTSNLVMKIQKYITYHLHEDLTLTRLGELVFLNPSYLSRLYKQLTGTGLWDYVCEQRINTAKQLLKESNLKIYEIAASVGYNSGIAFDRFFKKATGITPNEYREDACGS